MADQAFEASLAEGLAPTPVKAPRARCAKSLVSRPITFDYDNEASPKPLRRRCLLANVVGTALRFAAPAAAVAIIVAGHIRRRG